MSEPTIIAGWQTMGWLAAEVALLALAVAALCRLSRSAYWGRVFAQSGLVAVLLVGYGELSGTSGWLAGWFKQVTALSREETGPGPVLLDNPGFATAEPWHGAGPGLEAASPGFALREGEATEVSSAAPKRGPVGQGPEAAQPSWGLVGLGWIWALGALVVLGRAVIARLLLSVFFLRRPQSLDPGLQTTLDGLRAGLGIKRRVRLIESARLQAPIAFGCLRPTVGVPLNFKKYAPEKREAMLAHELAHLAAWDPAWCALADVAAALFWWHPLVWWLRRQLHLAGELAADEAGAAVANGPAVLAECLVELGAELTRPLRGSLGFGAFRSDLGRRVQRLLGLEGRANLGPGWLRAGLARGVAPLAMTSLVIFCTAWGAPRPLTKGESMKLIQQNWKHSLAMLGLAASLESASAQAPPPRPPRPPQSAPPGMGVPPGLPPEAGPPPAGFAPPAEPAQLRRERLHTVVVRSEAAAQLERKLRGILINEIAFDGVPLEVVVKQLGESARQLDPEKTGINFLIDRNPARPRPSIDPSTGLPVATEPIDLSAVMIKFTLPLRKVSMKDALDAIIRMADVPIAYSLEDYGVLFAAAPQPALAPTPAMPVARPAPSGVAVFKLETNTFYAGLESAFGIKAQSGKLRDHLASAIVDRLDLTGKVSVFYNENTGVGMVRCAPQDLEVIRAMIETLGGKNVAQERADRPAAGMGGRGGFGGGMGGMGGFGGGTGGMGVPGSPGAAPGEAPPATEPGARNAPQRY